ncbi:MAG: Abi family protein [Fimbriiglobus sp.]
MNEASPASFSKPWLSYSSQVQVLINRGLVVTDRVAAEAFLSHVNYYRFSGYCLAFEPYNSRHSFISGTTFEQIRDAYQFDLAIRDLLNEALEIVEVDLRANIAYEFGRTRHAYGHTQAVSFDTAAMAATARRRKHTNVPPHEEWLAKLREEVQRSKERFVQHFEKNYSGFPDLPIWVLTEVMSFGSLSMMFQWMQKAEQRPIALRYGQQPSILDSWIHHFVYVRNLCAHHSRLWDRYWSIPPELPAGNAWSACELAGSQRLAATLLILYRMSLRCPAISTFATEWKQRIDTVLAKPPTAPNAAGLMGLNPPLTANSLWK